MMSKLIVYTPYLESLCPNCKKKVKALRFDSKRFQINEKTHLKNTINILGCPVCRIVFFQEEDSEALRAVMEGKR